MYRTLAVLLTIVALFSASQAIQAQDRLITLETRGNHTSLDIVINPIENRGYIVYSLGDKGSTVADRIVNQAIMYSSKIDNWRFFQGAQFLRGDEITGARIPKAEMYNPVAVIDADNFRRANVTWSEKDLLDGLHRIQFQQIAKHGAPVGNLRTLSTDRRVMFNNHIANTPAGQIAIFSRYPDGFDQGDSTGLMFNYLNLNKRNRFGEQVLIPGSVELDKRTGNYYGQTTYCVANIAPDPCGVLPDDFFFLGCNEITAQTNPNGNFITRGGVASCRTFPNGRIQLDDTFWFFDDTNLESLIAVIDGNNFAFSSFWVFAASTTNVEYNLTVTDTQSNEVKTYTNDLGAPSQAVLDTSAFATCPSPGAVDHSSHTTRNYVVAYDKKKGRFLVKELGSDGHSLIGKLKVSKFVGRNVLRWVTEYKDGHVLIAFVVGSPKNNKIRLYDMEIEE